MSGDGSNELMLFGAGSCGRDTLRYLRGKGITPAFFVDNNSHLWGNKIDGVTVVSPQSALKCCPKATYVVTVYGREAKDIRWWLKQAGVKVEQLGKYLPICRELPSEATMTAMAGLLDSAEFKTWEEYHDQLKFRKQLDYDAQLPPSDIANIYFPEFINHLGSGEEVFVDCGAADGDTIRQFIKWEPEYKHVIGFEPDPGMYKKLSGNLPRDGICYPQTISATLLNAYAIYSYAVGDTGIDLPFSATNDCASHVDAGAVTKVPSTRLDDMGYMPTPTFIKMDIEGFELEALWGARRILREHKPVLAITAYHTAAHLWQIPLLIHTIQPEYELRLRRYAEGASELVWYAIPAGRII
jgi:FkbM family methyltransferase